MPNTIKLIEVHKLEKTFPVKSNQIPVLKDINLTIQAGEFIVITGPSGCGKSTLLHVLLGLEPPTSGLVYFMGKSLYAYLTEDERTEIRKKSFGIVYQQPNWIKSLTVIENVMFAMRINGEGDEVAKSRALSVLQMVGMGEWQDYIPTELSSGQQQKVALARAVITNPKVIIADEPTGNLDFKSGQEIMELLKKLNVAGSTIIMVTHDLEYLSFATRSLIMFDGKIMGEVSKKDLTDKLGSFKKLMSGLSDKPKGKTL